MSSQVRLIASFGILLLPVFANAQRAFDTDILSETFGFDAATQKTVSLADLHQGCPARDCIPSIDNPKYLAAGDADHVADDDRVIAISLNGDKRAYPARILDRHEIVNDSIGGVPVAITWCPLCGSAVGIERTLEGEVTEFGVSGVLYNSDLVLYDRASNTLWDQIEARGIVGPRTGEQLVLVPLTMTTWSRWQDAHPDTLVLSADTGFEIDYSRDPYERYRGSTGLMFPVSQEDDRIHPKTVVHGFVVNGNPVAYTHERLERDGRIERALGAQRLVATLQADGSVSLENEQGTSYVGTRLFWFAWYTFHPDTELVR